MYYVITTETAAFGPYDSEDAANDAAKRAGLVSYNVVPFSPEPPAAQVSK